MRVIKGAASAHRFSVLKLGLSGALGLAALATLVIGVGDLPRQQREAARWGAHSLEVIAVTSQLEADISTMASEGRGFFMDRMWESRARVNVAVGKIHADINILRKLTLDNPDQTDAIDRLAPLVEERIDHLLTIMDVFGAGNADEGMRLIRQQRGRAMMDQIVTCLSTIKADERALRAIHDETAQRAARGIVVGLVGSGMLAVFSLALAGAVLVGRRRGQQHVAALEAMNADLEARVSARTDELATAVARQRGYFQSSPIAIMVGKLGPRGLVLEDINPAAEELYALDRREAIGLTAAQLWPGPLGDEVERRLLGCIDSRQTVHYLAAREPRGIARLIDTVVAPLFDTHGNADSVIVCARDVTAERALGRQVVDAAERQAEAAERELAVFRNSADVLVVLRVEETAGEPDVYYETLSPALERLMGLRADTMLGARPQDCLPPELAGAIMPRYRQCISSRETVTYTQTYALPVGVRDYEGSIAPVIQASTGRVVRLVAMLRDVTERNRLEAALRHGQKMESIGRLAAGVAHDFNNILQSVTGGLELVLDEVAAGTPARQFASIALGAAQRGADLTHHLLSYARKQILRPRAIDLAAFLPEVELVLGRTLGPHIAVTVRAEPGLAPIHADPGQLETALINLAVNAAHAMPQGGTLGLQARADDGDPGRVILSVQDNGRGMDAQTLAQAFEPFFTTKGLDGTGLGLSMVQGFVEQSGGAVRIDSTPGTGTIVAMHLPVSGRAPVAAAAEDAPPAAAGRLLLVDDVDDVLLTTQAMLESAGFAVVPARSGREAIGLLADGERFDALVTDFAMPGMNGSALIEQGRCFQPDLPALIVTGFAELKPEDRPGGPASLLNKPFSRDQLVASLRALLSPGGPGPAAPDDVAETGVATAERARLPAMQTD